MNEFVNWFAIFTPVLAVLAFVILTKGKLGLKIITFFLALFFSIEIYRCLKETPTDNSGEEETVIIPKDTSKDETKVDLPEKEDSKERQRKKEVTFHTLTIYLNIGDKARVIGEEGLLIENTSSDVVKKFKIEENARYKVLINDCPIQEIHATNNMEIYGC